MSELEQASPGSGASHSAAVVARGAVRCVSLFARACSWFGLIVGGLSLALMFVYTTISVIGRYTRWYELLGADEVSGYAMAALIFASLPHTFRTGGFIRVSILYTRLSEAKRAICDGIFLALTLATGIVISYYFWAYIQQNYNFHVMTFGVIQVHLYLLQVVLGLGMAAFSLQVFALLLELIVTRRSPFTDVHVVGV